MKRVVCLYRVSTLGQVDHDDIPMQKTACREFIDQHADWEIVKEVSEKGVSGYKVSATARDAIVEIKKMAMARQFDILLVFMFDRLGRKDDETPFVLQWFVSQGIEVWSVKEGQQRFDNHVDKLLNYIRFWQASGESEKTAIRVRTKHSQMVHDGEWRGGLVAYGYRLEQHGRVNKKGQPVPDLAIDPTEADVVRQIFSMIANEGYGTNRVAQWLNDHGIKTKRDTTLWRGTSVRALIGNPIYTGVLHFGDELAGPFEHLRIISDELYEQCIDMVKARAPKVSKDRDVPLRTDRGGLLSGLLFCSECGNRLAYGHSKTVKKTCTGTHVYHRDYYRCYRKLSSNHTCAGQSTYTAQKLEACVMELVYDFFSHMKRKPRADLLEKANKLACSVTKRAYDEAEAEYEQAHRELTALEDEAMKAILGTSKVSAEAINNMLPKYRAKLEGAKAHMDEVEAKLKTEKEDKAVEIKQYKQFMTWADAFESVSVETKRIILSRLIERVEIGTGYKIHIQFRLSARQFWNDLANGDVKTVAV